MNDFPINSKLAIPSSLLAIAHKIPTTCMGLHIRQASPFLTHAFVPDILARSSGAVLNVASNGVFYPMPYMAIYATTKALILGNPQIKFLRIV